MGSYGVDAWMDCVVCGKWETDVRFVDCDSFGGVVCPRCFFTHLLISNIYEVCFVGPFLMSSLIE